MKLRGRTPEPAAPADLPGGSPIESLEAALGMVPARQRVPLPRWLGPLAVCCLVGMLPWIVYLGLTLPPRARAEHYDVAWLGFDCAMWGVLAALAVFALRHHPAAGPVAAIAAAMLVIDAWFDVTTSHGDDFVISLVLAVTAEVPLAIICAWAAFNAERRRARAYRNLWVRWQQAVDLARAADARAADARAAAARAAAAAVVRAPAKLSPPTARR
jgi:hypothetical protein